ncbi:MAG: hypothetical protein MJ092_07920 [Lachnospiraceae bacterium]|nr:hypothetical protein [Lachnospiraceae bacterium]
MIAFEKRSAMKIFYYLMSVDGIVSSEEQTFFNEIGASIDPEGFSLYSDTIIDECIAQMKSVFPEDTPYELISEGVDDAIFNHLTSIDDGVTPLHMIWNLLVMAFRDGEYADLEKQLIRHIVRVLKVERSKYTELEQYIKTTTSLEKELEELEQSNRPYQEVKPAAEAMKERMSVIVHCVEELIQDERFVPIEKIDVPNNVVAEGLKSLSDKSGQLFGATKEVLGSSAIPVAKDLFGNAAMPAAKDLGKQARKAFGSFLKR